MKHWIRNTLAVLAVAGAAFAFAGCGGQGNSDSSKGKTITDISGTKVEVPEKVHKIAILPWPWASVVFAMDNSTDRIGAVPAGALSAYKGHFMERMAPGFSKVDTQIIGQDFSFNAESLANAGIDSAIVWKFQDKDAERLKKIGIPAVMINNNTVDDLKQSFLIVGKLLGKEDRAKQLNAYYDNAYSEITKHGAEVEKAEKPTILYLKNRKLQLQGNDNFIHETLRIGGGHNPFGQDANGSEVKNLPMEEVYKINPDIILLSNFDDFVPDDLYENRIPGQDWSTVKAVQEHRVYKVPMGIYRWDAPGVETPLMMKWLAHLLQPDIFKDMHVREDTRKFFKDFMNYDLTAEDEADIFQDTANAHSQPLE